MIVVVVILFWVLHVALIYFAAQGVGWPLALGLWVTQLVVSWGIKEGSK